MSPNYRAKNGHYLVAGTPDEIAKMGAYGIKVQNHPELTLIFSEEKSENIECLNVKGYELQDKDKILKILQRHELLKDDLDLVRKYKSQLEMIFERLPDGTPSYPFSIDYIDEHIAKVKEITHLIKKDYDSFCKYYQLKERSFLLTNQSYGMMITEKCLLGKDTFIQIVNKGKCPANRMIIYIKSNKELIFLHYSELLKKSINLEKEMPDHIKSIIAKAKKISEGLQIPSKLNYQDTQFNRPLLSGFQNEINRAKKVDYSLKDGIIKIEMDLELMHNHSMDIYLSDIFLCPMLKKGEICKIEYDIHANNLPEPISGFLSVKGV